MDPILVVFIVVFVVLVSICIYIKIRDDKQRESEYWFFNERKNTLQRHYKTAINERSISGFYNAWESIDRITGQIKTRRRSTIPG